MGSQQVTHSYIIWMYTQRKETVMGPNGGSRDYIVKYKYTCFMGRSLAYPFAVVTYGVSG